MIKIIYHIEENEEKEFIFSYFLPFFVDESNNDWSPIETIFQREEIHRSGEVFFVEKITEEIDKNSHFNLPTQILLLTESFLLVFFFFILYLLFSNQNYLFN